MSKIPFEKKRINLFMPISILEEIDLVADELGANRTALINMVLRQYLDQRAVVNMSKYVDKHDKDQLIDK